MPRFRFASVFGQSIKTVNFAPVIYIRVTYFYTFMRRFPSTPTFHSFTFAGFNYSYKGFLNHCNERVSRLFWLTFSFVILRNFQKFARDRIFASDMSITSLFRKDKINNEFWFSIDECEFWLLSSFPASMHERERNQVFPPDNFWIIRVFGSIFSYCW